VGKEIWLERRFVPRGRRAGCESTARASQPARVDARGWLRAVVVVLEGWETLLEKRTRRN
jgi:hypothetical protein